MEMIFEVETLRDLWQLAGASVRSLARAMKAKPNTVYGKLNGKRTWFADELPALVEALNEKGRLPEPVTVDEVVHLLGASNVLVRGTLADHADKTKEV